MYKYNYNIVGMTTRRLTRRDPQVKNVKQYTKQCRVKQKSSKSIFIVNFTVYLYNYRL